MYLQHLTGSAGEQQVIHQIKCPNCSKSLMTLPENYPLFDVQCTACFFRAQIKTSLSKPKKEIVGAGWDIMEKSLRLGYLIPPLLTNFIWNEDGRFHQEIRFYPFIPKDHLKKRRLSKTAQRANYWMFNYCGLDALPYLIVFKK